MPEAAATDETRPGDGGHGIATTATTDGGAGRRLMNRWQHGGLSGTARAYGLPGAARHGRGGAPTRATGQGNKVRSPTWETQRAIALPDWEILTLEPL